MKKKKVKKAKKVAIFKFAFATEYGYWNETKSYFKSEEHFRKIFPDLPGEVLKLANTKLLVNEESLKKPKPKKPKQSRYYAGSDFEYDQEEGSIFEENEWEMQGD